MKKLLTILFALSISAMSFGAAKTWVGAATGGAWTTASNWNGTVVPTTGDYIVINLTNTNVITAVPSISLGRLKVTKSGGTARTLNLQGASDGVTITITYTAIYTDYDVSIGDKITLDCNTSGHRVNFDMKPQSRFQIECASSGSTGGVFLPAIYDPCDGGKGFLLEADATGHAELVEQNLATCVVQGWQDFYLANLDGATSAYHYIGLPVRTRGFSVGTGNVCRKANCLCFLDGNNVRQFSLTSQDWAPWMTGFSSCFDSALNFKVGVGYEVYARKHASEVLGNFNVAPSGSGILLPTSANDDNWSLVANPFPSGVLFQGQSGTGILGWTWSVDNFDTWVCYWNSTYDEYFYYDWYNGGGTPVAIPPLGPSNPTPNIIPRGQGFFVHDIYADNLYVDNQARQFATSKSIGKSVLADKNLLYLTLTDAASKRDYCLVQFNEKGSNSRNQMDMLKFPDNSPDKSWIYCLKNDNSVVIKNTLLSTNDNTAVPVYLTVGTTDGTFTISADNISTFGNNVGMILKDNKTNTTVDLRTTPSYTFTATNGDDAGRFILFFSNVLGVNKLTDNSIKVYASGSSIYVQNSNKELKGTVTVYDMLGKELMNVNLTNDFLTKLNTSFVNGYYIVSVTTDKGLVTQKVFIN